ncbi:MAG: hypothetical protein M9907_08670 [Burkholderiaceae bacterium]|nr:hypothetical protein [Burkholderiaceae bacterium]
MKTRRNPHAGTDVQSITLHADGYAWEALVRVAGVAYAASYIGARLQVRLAATERPSRRRAWHVEAVRVWALSKILALPPAWHARHEALHGVREQREAVRRAALDRLVALEGQAA